MKVETGEEVGSAQKPRAGVGSTWERLSSARHDPVMSALTQFFRV